MPPFPPGTVAAWQTTPAPASAAARDAPQPLPRDRPHAPPPSRGQALKHVLGQIQTDHCNLFHGWLPSVGVVENPTVAHRCRKGDIHPIIARSAAISTRAFPGARVS